MSSQGYRYYQTQAGDGYALNGLNYYLLARLLWDPSLDAHAIEKDYIESGFGRAASAVGRYFARLRKQWNEAAGQQAGMDYATVEQYQKMAAIYPPEFREACRRDLDEAYDLAQGRDRERVVFLQRGWSYVDLTLQAIEKTIPLLQAGWPKSGNPDVFRPAWIAWEERERYVETLKQDFVAYFWERYNVENRSFVPLKKIREYAARNLPEGGRPFTESQVKQWRLEIGKALFVPDPLPLEAKSHGTFEPAPGVVAERVTYATEFGLRVPAILYLPKQRSGKFLPSSLSTGMAETNTPGTRSTTESNTRGRAQRC